MTLQEWLEEKKNLSKCLTVDVKGPEQEVIRAIVDVSRMARTLPVALRIIEAVREELNGSAIYDFDELAERILNEPERNG